MSDAHDPIPKGTLHDGESTARETPAMAGRAGAPAGPGAVPGYEVLGEAGRGGMGVVYKARQLGLNRVVALKMVLGEDIADEKAVIRFLAEAEAVAAVHHPNVVQVYDYGEHAGRPYMALEFCPGGRLYERLKNGPLPPREAAELVAAIASGVAAAHGQGIVHRDLKPSNVLFDEHGAPKVADFGLAKRGGVELTHSGALLGTPAYMSPEQAGVGTKFIGPAADVYSLGVILYECLTGDRPFRSRDVDVLLAMIRADAPPPPRKLAPQVPRDLETVCLKCLAKDPADRYPTANELADDLERFLAGKPVKARPIGAAAQLLRWARRNPVEAGLVVTVLAVSVGLVGSLAQQYRQAEASAAFERQAKVKAELQAEELAHLRDEAVAEAARANQVSDFLAGLFRSSDPLDIFGTDFVPPDYGKLRGRTARDFLDDAAKQFTTGLKDQPQVRARLLLTVGNSYRNLGEFARARPLLEEALQLRRGQHGPDSPEAAEVEMVLAQLDLDTGDYFAAEERFRRVLDVQTRAGVDEKARALTRAFVAFALAMQGRPEAKQLLRDEIATRTELFGPTDRQTILVRIGLIALLFDEGQGSEAMKLLPDLMTALEQQKDDQIQAVIGVLSEAVRGVALRFTSHSVPAALRPRTLRQAETTLIGSLKKARTSLPEKNIYVALIHFELGCVYAEQGERALARAEFVASYDMAKATCGLAHPKVITLVRDFGHMLAETGRPLEARWRFAEVLRANLDRFGPDNPWRAVLLAERAAFEATDGHDTARAWSDAREVVAIAGRKRLVPTRVVVVALSRLSMALPLGDAPATADALLAVTRPMAVAVFGDASKEVGLLLFVHGHGRYFGRDWAVGAELLRAAEERGSRFAAGDQAMLARDLGVVARDQGRFADAERYLRRADDIFRREFPADTRYRQTAQTEFAAVLAEREEYAEAARVLATAYRSAPPGRLDHHDHARLAMFRLAAGDVAGAAEPLRRLAEAARSSPDPRAAIDAARAWAFAPPDLDGFDAAAAARRLVADWKTRTHDNWPLRAAARAQLRAGDPAGAAATIRGFGGPHLPADNLILGLAAVALGDPAEARARLAAADAMTEAARPSPADPFAFARVYWFDRIEARLMRADLVRALDPGLAPPPRPGN
jgi:tetratricopeptide (TPR) repeat protein